jgi:twinfilin-like protein
MSHSSGIPVSESLKKVFGAALSENNKRLIKAVIENEEIVNKHAAPISSNDWEHDLELIPSLLEVDQACYILYRLDTQGPTGFNWVLMCYVPDKCKVKDKMLYASTRSNLKQQLGASFFCDEIFGTVAADFNKKGYELHVASKKMEAPLTEQEQLKVRETGEFISGVSSTYVHGVAFPVNQDAQDAIKKLISGSVNYVQIAIDCDHEKITLDHTATLSSFNDFPSHVPIDVPRFHFFAYKHDFEGQSQTAHVFLFSCPDGSKNTKSAPVKQRMLYSSSKANVSNMLAASGGSIGTKFEINAGDDVTEENIHETLHPKKAEEKKAFSKPSRPGKGGARLTKKDA